MPTAEQDGLIDAAVAVFGRDPRVLGLWLSGSLGAGRGDAWSDVDLLAAVAEADLAAIVADYADDLSGFAPTVFSRVLHGRVVTAVTRDWERFDLLFVSPAELGRFDERRMQRLLGDLRLGAGSASSPPPSAQRIRERAEEFLRVLGLGEVGARRGETIVMQQGVGLLRDMTIETMLDANGVSPGERGVKRLNAYLTEEQRAALAALPPAGPDAPALLAHAAALAHLFLPLAKQAAADPGVEWPAAFEAATRRRLSEKLGVEI